MPEREFLYTFRSEDQSSAALDAISGSALQADAALEAYIRSTEQSTAASQQAALMAQAFAGAEESLAAAGIQTTASIEAQIVQYDRLLDFVQSDVVATQQLTERKLQLQAQLSRATASQQKFGAATGQVSGFVNQFAFTLNDAQQAQFGLDALIRATSNNVGFMISQFQSVVATSGGFSGAMKSIARSLVGPLGISVAFNAITTAAVLLQGAFKDTADKGTGAADKLEEEFAPLIKIIDAVQGAFEFTFEQAEKQQAELKEQIEATRAEMAALETQAMSNVATFGSFPQGASRLADKQRENVAEAERLQDVLTDQERQLAAINSQLRDEQARREKIAELEAAGFKFTKDKTEEEKKAEKEAEKRRLALEKEQSTLKNLTEERAAYIRVLSDANAGELEQIALIEEENRKLEQQIEIRKRLFVEAERRRDIEERFGERARPTVAEIAPIGTGFEPFQMAGAGVEARRQLIEQSREHIRGLSDETIDEADRIAQAMEDRLFADVEHFIELNERLSDVLATSLASGVEEFGAAIGEVIAGTADFEKIGQTLLLTLANLGANIGKQLIAFGVAGLAIRKLITNPVAAIIAGGALIALSRALSASVQRQIDSATSGGGAAGTSSLGSIRADAAPTSGQLVGVNNTTTSNSKGLTVDPGGRPVLPNVRSAESTSTFKSTSSGAAGQLAGVNTTGNRGAVVEPAGAFVGRPQKVEVSLTLKAADPIVLPHGTLVFAIREALQTDAELGGTGSF